MEASQNIQFAFQSAMGEASFTLEQFLVQLATGTETFSSSLAGLARGLAGAVLGGLSQFAAGEAAKHLAAAFGMQAFATGFIALGQVANASAAALSSKQHFLAAAKWTAVAAVAGAGASLARGGGGTGAGAAGGGGAGRNTEPVANPRDFRQEIHVHLEGELAVTDVQLQRKVFWLNKLGQELMPAGESRVEIHR
jgi:hypothetical protein